MVDELDIVRGDEAPVVCLDLRQADAAVELGLRIAIAVRAFLLPAVIDGGCPRDLLAVEHDLLLLLALDRMLPPRAQVEEQHLPMTVAQLAPMVVTAPFILVQDPERHADIRRDEEIPWQDDNGFHLVMLQQLLPDREGIAIVQGTVREQESRHARQRFQMGEDMQYPGIVRIALRRHAVVDPACVVREPFLPPVLEIERRIRHDIVEIQPFMQVVFECGNARLAQIVADAAQGQIHLGQAQGRRFLFLPVHVDAADIPLARLDEIRTLDKHAARAAARIIERPVKGLNHRRDQLHRIMRRIELALLLRSVDGKLLEKIFVNASDEVFFLTELLMADFIDLIDQLLDIARAQSPRGKRAFVEAASEPRIRRRDAVQGRVQRRVQLWRRRVDDGRPACFLLQVIRAVRKGRVIEKCRMNLRCLRIQPLFPQLLRQIRHAILELLPDKAQEYQRQHQIALLKERARITRLAQNITAFEQHRIQIQCHFFFLLCHSSKISSYAVPNDHVSYHSSDTCTAIMNKSALNCHIVCHIYDSIYKNSP